MVYYCFYLFIVCSFYEFLVFFVEECLIGVYKILKGNFVEFFFVVVVVVVLEWDWVLIFINFWV